MPAKPAARRETSAAFFDVVRRQLADVPWEPRQRLLAEVASRLDALPERARPEEVLGAPRAYARLVREAAGYPPNRVRPFPYFRALRRRNKVLVLVVPLLVALIGGGVTAVRHYQPLRADADVGYSNAKTIDDPLLTGVDFYHYRENATVVTGIELKNTGRVTVTVTRALIPHGLPLALVELRAQHDLQLIGLWQRATRVARLSVHPGETVELFLVMKMTRYHLVPDSNVHGPLPRLEVEVLGTTHTIQLSGNDIGFAQ